jgi:DNA-binding transcriptional MerR regulator
VRDLCDLVDRYFRDGKRALLSVGEQVDTRSASGRMVLNMLTVIGQWEREAIGERTSAAMQHKASQGEYTGGAAPYGHALAADGAALVEVESEQAVIAEARALRATGLSLRKVAEALDALVAQHPELVGPTGPDNVNAWIETLETDEKGSQMPKEATTQVAFRLPDSLIARLDRHTARMTKENPGLDFSRADAVRSLLTRALDQVEATKRGGKGSP